MHSNSSITERKVGLPPEFFEYMRETTNKKASLYKCLFKGCKPKTNKDGTPKYLKIKNDSRGNGKRHYLVNYCYLNYRMQILYWFWFH